MYEKILVPGDGSKFAKRAMENALFLALKTNAEILTLNVVDTNYYVGLPVEESICHLNDVLKEEAHENLNNLKNIGENKTKITTNVVEGSPANEILKFAEKNDIDLIIMGSSGKTGFEKFLMGSVADKVVRNSKCPVLIVH